MTRIPKQTSTAAVDWTGEASAKVVSELSFAEVTVPATKIACVVVITDEVARFSAPSAVVI
jgi:HK97 family phage major capsid protein